MKIHSNELLRAVRACQAIAPKRPTATEFGMVRIRAGWGIDCCEAFNGDTLVRYSIKMESSDGERLDSAFEYKPLVAWLDYVDGEIEISENGGVVLFEFGASFLEKAHFDATSFPPKSPPNSKHPYVILDSDDWSYLAMHTEQDPEKALHGSTDLGALHIIPVENKTYGFTTNGIWSGLLNLEAEFFEHERKSFCIPSKCITQAFKSTGGDTIKIERLDNGFYVGLNAVEIFVPLSAGINILDWHCKQVLEKNQPFVSVAAHEIHSAASAIMNGSAASNPRLLFYTLDGMLHVAGGELYDFHSLPIRPFPVEIPEDFSKILVDARRLHEALDKVAEGQLWFISNPAEGMTRFKVVGENRQTFIQPMKRKDN